MHPTPTLDRATEFHRAGRLAEAETHYREVLITNPAHPDALQRLGLLAMQLGRPSEAIQLITRAVATAPESVVYQCSLGQALLAGGDALASAAVFTRALALSINRVEAHFGLGLAMQSLNRTTEAIEAYQRALTLQPDHLSAANNLGNVLQLSGRAADAIAVYEKAIRLAPGHAELSSNYGSALIAAGRMDDAIALYRKVLAANPESPPLLNNLGTALLKIRELPAALDAFRQAVSHCPDFAQAHYNLANALRDTGRLEESLASYERALQLLPAYVEAHINYGNALAALGLHKQAAESYLAALKHRPDHVDAYNNLGAAMRTMGYVDEAIAAFRQGLALKPDFALAYCNLGNAFKDAGQLDEAIASYRRALELRPADVLTHSNLIYTLHYHPKFDAAEILSEHRRFDAMHARHLRLEASIHRNDPVPHRRLRIGYVSPDFRDHCQSLFTIPLLSHHDHGAVEIYCYSTAARRDAITDRIAGYADVWRNLYGMTDAQAAERIADDRIDILIDLTMHMSVGRPLLFARRPAPIQIAWLAYPGTTGLSAMDYRFTDPYLDPPGEGDDAYSEISIRLPDTFWCYDPMNDDDLLPGALPARANGFITFGCLNNFCKITDPTLNLWREVLHQTPNSRLILLSPRGQHRQRLIGRLCQDRIAPERIEFLPYQPRAEYLRAYPRIDIGLDTIPYNGHTTTLDSLWMGVPVITRVGHTAVGRAGWSQLSNLGLQELAAASDPEFVATAVNLANDLPRLTQLRQSLRRQLEQSPLMDGKRFARGMESAYRQLWEKYCSDLRLMPRCA